MRKTASEILRNLENRVARLEKKASKPMFNLTLIKEVSIFEDTDDSGMAHNYDTEYEELVDEDIYSFEELIEELDNNSRINNWSWGEWSDSRPEVNGSGRKAYVNSYSETNYRTGAEEQASLHFNPARGVSLDRDQIKLISKTLGMR